LFSLTENITIDGLQDDLFVRKGISVDILRLDKVHPVVSGNKLFKLHYFLQEALQSGHRHIITFGGGWSNHLVATAFACREMGLLSTGIVRSEVPDTLSCTLQQCRELGMQLYYAGRAAYNQKETAAFQQKLEEQYGPHLLVPEGGYHPTGAKGAAMIMNNVPQGDYSHIACSLGTATTVAGLLSAAAENQLVMGFCALKGMTDIDNRLHYLLDGRYNPAVFMPVHDYCFAGYAKKDPAVFSFMNRVWQKQRIPTDFVYTAKMLYGVYDMADNDFFTPGSRILCLHTGGLQGNLSLPVETLTFGNI
jgi:1-aminocyclopropane-1-carboxylate deaminase/D-cysteine desulfhydrase-like pyridoxal-dependent ACC family enzyme